MKMPFLNTRVFNNKIHQSNRKHNTLQQAQNNTHERADMQRDQTVMIARCTHLNGHHSIKQSCPKSSELNSQSK